MWRCLFSHSVGGILFQIQCRSDVYSLKVMDPEKKCEPSYRSSQCAGRLLSQCTKVTAFWFEDNELLILPITEVISYRVYSLPSCHARWSINYKKETEEIFIFKTICDRKFRHKQLSVAPIDVNRASLFFPRHMIMHFVVLSPNITHVSKKTRLNMTALQSPKETKAFLLFLIYPLNLESQLFARFI